jgi:hypothetical protein
MGSKPQGMVNPKYWGGIVGGLTLLILGRWWFGKKLSKYLGDRTAYLAFDSEADSRIASWQKWTVLLLCILIIPFLARLFTFGTQVLTKAFDLSP